MLDPKGAKIGRFDLTGFTTGAEPGRENRLQTAELDWDDSDDSLIVQTAHDFKTGGSLPDNQIRWAIVGGTGKYDTARGSCTTVLEGSTFRWKCLVKP
ncbi:MAG: hypothetical protein ACR2JI_17290 [Mycobacterium sp.]